MHDPGELEFDDLDLFLGPDVLISVRSGDSVVFESVRVRAEQEQVDRLDRLFYMIVVQIVDGYQPVLDKLADEIEDVVLDRPDPETLARTFSLKRKLVEFRRVAGGMREVVNSLLRLEKGLVGDDLDPHFRDVYDHIMRSRPDRDVPGSPVRRAR